MSHKHFTDRLTTKSSRLKPVMLRQSQHLARNYFRSRKRPHDAFYTRNSSYQAERNIPITNTHPTRVDCDAFVREKHAHELWASLFLLFSLKGRNNLEEVLQHLILFLKRFLHGFKPNINFVALLQRNR